MPDTSPTQRVSATTSILDRYNKSTSVANVGGGSAKDVGTPKAETNMIDTPQKYSEQFKVRDAKGFTSVAEKYSTDVLRVSTEKYAPSGRK